MTPRTAFIRLVRSTANRKKGSDLRLAMLIGAGHIAEMSGCWPPDETIWNVAPTEYAALKAMLREEGIE